MSLIELTVVLLILIALAGLAVPYVSGTNKMAVCQTTDASLQAIKEAIVGGGSSLGFFSDTLGYYPANDSTAVDFNLYYLLNQGSWIKYNPKTGVGWRGPYISGGSVPDAGIDASFSDIYVAATNPTGKVHDNIKDINKQQIMDAWFRPIIIQVPYDTVNSKYQLDNARLVSAGPGSGMKPDDAQIDTTIHNNIDASGRGDDRVLFLFKPDPLAGGNEDCVDFT